MDLAQLSDLRNRVLRKEPVSDEELRQALEALRSARSSAGTARAATTASTAKPKIEIDLSTLFGKK